MFIDSKSLVSPDFSLWHDKQQSWLRGDDLHKCLSRAGAQGTLILALDYSYIPN